LRESLPLVLRRGWLRLRWGHRIEFDSGAFVGHGVRLELEGGARLALGSGVWLGGRSRVRAGGAVRFGRGTLVGPGCAVVASREVTVGEGCILGDEVMLSDTRMRYDDLERPTRCQPAMAVPLRVHDGARIGPRACLLAGAEVGEGSVVGARVVVEGHVPAGAVFSSVPAGRQTEARRRSP
jgi:acetyltransferase-like isoleucine patch superfamily enzyme